MVQVVCFRVSPSKAALSHRKSASAETSRDSCGAQDSDQRDAVLRWVSGCKLDRSAMQFGKVLAPTSVCHGRLPSSTAVFLNLASTDEPPTVKTFQVRKQKQLVAHGDVCSICQLAAKISATFEGIFGAFCGS